MRNEYRNAGSERKRMSDMQLRIRREREIEDYGILRAHASESLSELRGEHESAVVQLDNLLLDAERRCVMGTPKNPEVYDTVALTDMHGVTRNFMVVYVDDWTVVCDSGSRLAHFDRDEFERLFAKGGAE